MRKIFVIIAFLSVIFTSCDSEDSEIVSTTASAVFDFKNEKDAPSAHLSFFVQINNELQRSEFMEIKKNDSSYVWRIVKPQLISNDNKKWAGSSNIVYPDGQNIENGTFTIMYQDAAGNEVFKDAKIEFDKKLLKCTAKDCKKLINSGVVENYALYDDAKNLIFFGRKKSAWNENADILKEYGSCKELRVCYSTVNNSIICLMPAEKVEKVKK